MAKKFVYQTLEDKGNLDEIEQDGPFLCNRANAWLGAGYYFWDTFIENAHWWGKECNSYKDGYIICKAVCDYNDDDCFDLVGNTEHFSLFNETYEYLKSKGLVNKDTTVSRVIQYLRNDLKIFTYSACRVVGNSSKSFNSSFRFSLLFNPKKNSYLDLKPPIQICFYKKTSLNLRNYQIVFPVEYIEGYAT